MRERVRTKEGEDKLGMASSQLVHPFGNTIISNGVNPLERDFALNEIYISK
jgi:hypothetical protein